jgi:hypothetical protein
VLIDCLGILDVYDPVIREQLSKVKKDIDTFVYNAEKLFNLQLPEEIINQKLDELLFFAVKHDLRGFAVDMLFYLKESRDANVNELVKLGLDIE